MAGKNVELKFTALDRASGIISKITDKIDTLKNKMNQAQNINPTKNAEQALGRVSKLTDRAASLGRTMTAAVSLPMLGAGKELVVASADYQLALRDLQMRIDNLEPGQIELLGQKARQLGVSMGVGATEATKAMTEFAKAGATFKVLQNGAAETALALSRAESISADNAAGLISNMMKVFGLEADQIVRIGDVLGKAAGVSSISIVDLENSMRHATSTASSYGLKLEQVASAVATFGNIGIKGEMGGTTLRSLMNSIGGDANRQAKLVAAGARKEDFFNTDGTMKGFGEIFKALNGLNLKAEQFTDIFGKEFGGSIRRASDAFAEFDNDLKKVNDSAGFLSKLAEAKLNTFWGRWDQMKAAFKDIGAGMAEDGTLDMLKDFVEVIRDLLVWLNKLDPGTKKWLLALSAIVAILPPILWFVGSLAGSIAALTPIVTTAGLAGTLAFGGWSLLILAGVAAIIYLLVNLDKVKKTWGKVMDWCEDRWGDFVGSIGTGVNKIIKLYNSLPGFMRGEKVQLWDERDGEQRRREDDKNFVQSFTEPSEWKRFDPADLIDVRNQSTLNVNMQGVPWGTQVSTQQDYGKSKVNLDVGYTSKYMAKPVLGMGM